MAWWRLMALSAIHASRRRMNKLRNIPSRSFVARAVTRSKARSGGVSRILSRPSSASLSSSEYDVFWWVIPGYPISTNADRSEAENISRNYHSIIPAKIAVTIRGLSSHSAPENAAHTALKAHGKIVKNGS